MRRSTSTWAIATHDRRRAPTTVITAITTASCLRRTAVIMDAMVALTGTIAERDHSRAADA